MVKKIWAPLGKFFAPPGVLSWLRACDDVIREPPTFSVFKVMYHDHTAFSPSAMSVMPSSQERILGWSYLRLDQK